MSVTIDDTGVQIQTFEEAVEEIVLAYQTAFSLTAAQTNRIRTSLLSTLGQDARIAAERDVLAQEAALAVSATLSFDADGAALDRVVELLGVARRAAFASQVTGTASGTATTVIPNGTQIRYAPESTVWVVSGGPYTIGGGGTVSVTLTAQDTGALTVALDPDTGYDDWEILDVVTGFDAFESSAQPITGADIETSAALRQRARTQAFSRAGRTTRAIEASVIAVTGVEYVRAYHNPTESTDADGLPPHAINVVVVGGTDADVAEAIAISRPAGSPRYALAGGTYVSVDVTDEYGLVTTEIFNRVEDVTIHVKATLTTSTSEEAAPVDLETIVKDLLLAQAQAIFDIGDDILPWRLAGAIHAAGYPGIDNVVVELSLDDVSFSTAKRVMTIRQKGSFSLANIDVVED